jgi:hypothetical protein
MHKIGKEKDNIEVISVWFNEALIAPYFLGHYSFADKIHIIIDADTTDDTAKVAAEYPNVVIHYLKFPDKFDDIIKINKINEVYSSIKNGWVIAVDSDELVFPLPLGTDIRGILRGEGGYDVLYAQMWDVYRHKTDNDLDPIKDAALQRRHGNREIDMLYSKPCVVRAGLDFKWECGCHNVARSKNKLHRLINKLMNIPRVSPTMLYGAHWRYADPTLVKYRVKNRNNRLSNRNLSYELSVHFNEEVADILTKCEMHLVDPLLF